MLPTIYLPVFTSRLIQNNYMSPHLQSIECSFKPAQKCNLIKAITAYAHEEVAEIKDLAKSYTSNLTG